MFIFAFVATGSTVFAQSGDGRAYGAEIEEPAVRPFMANDAGLAGSAVAQTEYNYYNNNYEYSNTNYEYDTTYDLDGYSPTGFGNETDVMEGAVPQQKKQKNKAKGQAKDASSYNEESASAGYGSAAPASTGYGSTEAASAGYGEKAPLLKCWNCHADSFDLCEQTGYLQTCQENEESCELEIRERKGFVLQIFTGCKSKEACTNNMANNFQGTNPAYTQCRPEGPEEGYMHSVCRQCCSEENCIKDPDWWFPQTRDEWAYTGEETAASPY